MKRFFKLSSMLNVLFWCLLAYLFYLRLPSVLEHWKIEDSLAPDFEVALLSGSIFSLKNYPKPLVIVFWATWCGPCEIELTRINKMIESGSIKADSILAISTYEDPDLVRKVVLERQYRFLTGIDSNGKIGDAYQIKGTPTIVFVDREQKISWITTGLSPLLGVRIEKFLAP